MPDCIYYINKLVLRTHARKATMGKIIKPPVYQRGLTNEDLGVRRVGGPSSSSRRQFQEKGFTPRPVSSRPNPGKGKVPKYEKTFTGEDFRGNKDINQDFYDSPEFKNFSITQTLGGMSTMDFNESKYGFGKGSGSNVRQRLNAIDSAYEKFLQRTATPGETNIPNDGNGMMANVGQAVGQAVAGNIVPLVTQIAQQNQKRGPKRRQPTTGTLGSSGSLL